MSSQQTDNTEAEIFLQALKRRLGAWARGQERHSKPSKTDDEPTSSDAAGRGSSSKGFRAPTITVTATAMNAAKCSHVPETYRTRKLADLDAGQLKSIWLMSPQHVKHLIPYRPLADQYQAFAGDREWHASVETFFIYEKTRNTPTIDWKRNGAKPVVLEEAQVARKHIADLELMIIGAYAIVGADLDTFIKEYKKDPKTAILVAAKMYEQKESLTDFSQGLESGIAALLDKGAFAKAYKDASDANDAHQARMSSESKKTRVVSHHGINTLTIKRVLHGEAIAAAKAKRMTDAASAAAPTAQKK